MDVAELLLESVITCTKLGAIVAIPILILAVLHHFLLMAVGGHAGYRWQLISGVVGVPHHETSHLLAVYLLGMRPLEVVFFKPDPQSRSLGHVKYEYNASSIIQSFGTAIVGIAPLISGLLLVNYCFSLLIADWPKCTKPFRLWRVVNRANQRSDTFSF